MPSNFLLARGFTWQSIEDRIADRVWQALRDDEPLRTVMGGKIFRTHINLSGVGGRPPLCLLVAVIRPEETPRPSLVLEGSVSIAIILEFEEFASDQLQPGEPSVASLCSYMRTLVDRRLSRPMAGEERVASGAVSWPMAGPVPTEIKGSLTSFFVAMEIRVPYKVSNPGRENLLAPVSS